METLPIEPTLLESLKSAKQKFKESEKALLDVQYAIFESVKDKLPEEGTTHFDGLKISTGFYSKWSDVLLEKAEQKWKHNVPFPFKKVYKADGKQVNYLKKNMPMAYADFEIALTVTPRKPSFTLTGEEEDHAD